ncbi:MAG TPA: DUF1638 domain-containing protein [Proteobacteria bacterium]|nr:DUF1638 domain-containing protein [Pseudomonadota bacterium]
MPIYLNCEEETVKLDAEATAIVSCGTLRPELTRLAEEGFLNREKLFFTAPGLHERMPMLESQLTKRLEQAKAVSKRVIVVYGKLCYVDVSDPYRAVDALCAEAGSNVARVKAANCVDMLADEAMRERIANGSKVYWFTPGWILYWNAVFYEWDVGKYNETFGRFDRAILLDPIGLYDRMLEEEPEKILELSDRMGIPFESYFVSLDRLKSLLLDAESSLDQSSVTEASGE